MTFYHSHIPTFAKNKLVCNMRTIIFKKQTISVPLKSGQININQTIPEKGKN